MSCTPREASVFAHCLLTVNLFSTFLKALTFDWRKINRYTYHALYTDYTGFTWRSLSLNLATWFKHFCESSIVNESDKKQILCHLPALSNTYKRLYHRYQSLTCDNDKSYQKSTSMLICNYSKRHLKTCLLKDILNKTLTG